MKTSLLWQSLCAIALSTLLTACGGGDDESDDDGSATPPTVNPPAPGPTSISGVAAAGLPLIGAVLIKDASGQWRSAEIGSNGAYNIDTNGLTAPFLLQAIGSAGGRQYVLHSAAVSTDVGGTINITPFTDLIVSNIAGDLASQYFNGMPDNRLSAAALNEEMAQLRSRLLPVLQALGVSASADLLRTAFTPLSSALDRALDILRIDYQAGVATITNVVTQQQILDDLSTRAAQETAAALMNDTTNLTQAGTDLSQIRALFTTFSNLFANGLPSAGAVQTHLSSTFRERDMTGSEFAGDLVSYSFMSMASFTDVAIDGFDYTGPNPIARVTYVIRSNIGNEIAHMRHWQVIRENGVWKLHGNQRALDIEPVASMVKHDLGNGSVCFQSGLTLFVEDNDVSNNNGVIDYITVQGPGIPMDNPVRLLPDAFNTTFAITPQTSNGGAGNYYVTADTCRTPNFQITNLSLVPSDAEYTFTAHAADNSVLLNYTDIVPNRPLSIIEMTPWPEFPTVTPSYATFANYNGGALNVSAGSLDAFGMVSYRLLLMLSNGDIYDTDFDRLASLGTVSATLTLPAPPVSVSINARLLEVSNLTRSGRTFITRYYID